MNLHTTTSTSRKLTELKNTWSTKITMHPDLEETLVSYRKHRNFNPHDYLEAKSALLNLYFSQSGIKACIVGISGGIDSAVVAAILVHASRLPGSPLKRIVPLILPMHAEGATHQDIATARGTEVCQALDIPPIQIDLSSTLQAARKSSLTGSGVRGSAWAAGQLVSYLRTPILYYHAALVSEEGLPCVLCGTTNRDEGSYIGFFGKASDGMVDVQLISDLHKSEVYELATLLGIPHSIMTATPSGDTYDGLCDEEMIGTSYDFLELYEWWLCQQTRETWLKSLSTDASREFKFLAKKLEGLHQKNKHKYIGDSPAVHLDVLTRAVPGGWRRQAPTEQLVISREETLQARVGPVELPKHVVENLDFSQGQSFGTDSVLDFGSSVLRVSEVLSSKTCSKLLSEAREWSWVEADEHGRPIQRGSEASITTVGSYRTTAYDEGFASRLWQRLSLSLPEFRTMTELCPTDHNGYPVWKPIGVNPMLRFIRYENGGYLVPHYDAGFDFQNGRHTLMSVVISLVDSPDGGTRFLLDKQRHLPLNERSFEDFESVARDEDILYLASECQGDALIFDHRILHDAPMWRGSSPRIILRTDIIFERCASHAISRLNPVSRLTPDGSDIYSDESVSFSPKVRTASLQKLFHNLSNVPVSAPLTVLVTTGGMCPLHKGHLNMMQQAKETVERSGKAVIAGFIIPDHDSYVKIKTRGGALSIGQRLQLAEEAVSNSDWLSIDHWAGFHLTYLVNFTTIADRLAAQLSAQIPIARPVEVIYVCGGDNARFGLSFVDRGSCVVVSRPGYDAKVESMKSHFAAEKNPRIVFASGNTNGAASTDIRRGNLEELPQSIVRQYMKMRDEKEKPVRPVHLGEDKIEEVNFYVRCEGEWAVSHWTSLPGADISTYSRAYDTFCTQLIQAFQNAFEKARQKHGGSKVHIIPLRLPKQRSHFQKLREGPHSNDIIISLDPCIPSTLNLAISRSFEPVSVLDECEYVARPGSTALEKQIDEVSAAIGKKAPNQRIFLFDDDSSTGKTLSTVQSLIQARDPKCKVDGILTLCDSNGPPDLPAAEKRQRLNLVDCRDFLAGSREGGLVIRVPRASRFRPDEELCRVPYVLPFVRPAYRASVPVDQEVAFSRKIRQLNIQFMKDVGLSKDDMQHGFASLLHDWIGLKGLFG